MKQIELYTDGACRNNPGPGGWACILRFGEKEKTLRGAFRRTTNNRMELYAAIVGLSALKEPCRVSLFSDSQYIVNGLNRWIANRENPHGTERRTAICGPPSKSSVKNTLSMRRGSGAITGMSRMNAVTVARTGR